MNLLMKLEDANYPDSAFIDACANGDLNKVETMYDQRGNLKSWDPLNIAVVNNKPDVVEFLISNGEDPDIKDNFGNTPLYNACANGYNNIVKILIKTCDVNARSMVSPLFIACKLGHVKVVKTLLTRSDIEVNSMNGDLGLTPLHAAVIMEHVDIVKLLLEDKRTDILKRDLTFTTVFECMEHNKEIHEMLLSKLN